jgi:hypothetical protein
VFLKLYVGAGPLNVHSLPLVLLLFADDALDAGVLLPGEVAQDVLGGGEVDFAATGGLNSE